MSLREASLLDDAQARCIEADLRLGFAEALAGDWPECKPLIDRYAHESREANRHYENMLLYGDGSTPPLGVISA